MKKSAFTLIELLVVISIIAILAGIALPVYNGVLERSRATSDASNLRQIGIGTAAYLNDFDDQIFASTSAVKWPVTLQSKYVSNWKVFRSPFDKPTSGRPDKEVAPGIPVSYGVNFNILNQDPKKFDGNVSKYVSPSQLIFMAPAMEDSPDISFIGNSETPKDLTIPKAPTTKKDYRGTHASRGQINVLFGDSHVTSTFYREFATSTGEDGLKRWLPLGQ